MPEFTDRVLAGRYRLERELGRGGMAIVYAAVDEKHGRRVAVKVMDREIGAVSNTERFLREIRVTAGLQHAHILPLYDSGEADGRPFYVMPLVSGSTLRQRLEREGQLPITDAVRIATVVADALQHAHEHGIVHRDIKPENILFDGTHIFVADLGIAKLFDRGDEALTATGLSLGTPMYMSPEQATGETYVDARSDVYSLGCVLYEMLAGEPPFPGRTAQAVIAKRLAGPPPSVTILRDTVPASVAELVTRAMALAPADRFATAGDLARALNAVDGAASSPPSPRRRQWQPLAIAGGVLLLAVAGSAIAAHRATRSASVVPPGRDSIAYDLFRRAEVQANSHSVFTMQRGIALYREAIRRDSNFADAWAGLARALQYSRTWRYPIPGVPADSMVPLMVRASERAVEADSTSALAWVSRAVVLREIEPGSRRAMIQAALRAVRADSLSAEAWFILAGGWRDSLEPRRAIDAYHHVLAVDPRHGSSLGFLTVQYTWARDYDSALVWSDSGQRVDPTNMIVRQTAGLLHRVRGELAQAESEFRAGVRMGEGPDRIIGWVGLAEIARRRGDTQASDTLAAHAIAGADTLHPTVHEAAYLAWLFTALGQRERALRILERYDPRSDLHFRAHLLNDETLDPIRGEKRFRALLER